MNPKVWTYINTKICNLSVNSGQLKGQILAGRSDSAN